MRANGESGASDTPIALPGFTFDPERGDLLDAAGTRIPLRPQTLAVLACLARKAGRVVGKDELMRMVWPDVVGTDDSLVQCVRELRQALGDVAHRIIQTEAKRGYRLVPSQAEPDAPPRTSRTPSGNAPLSQQIRFARSENGIRIAYGITGSGPALVRTAQWMTHLELDLASSIFGDFLRRISQDRTLVRYDGRGCGLSDRGLLVNSLDDELRDLEAVVDDAGLDRFALIGRSQGATIAIRYAARHPERVTKLVSLGGFVQGNQLRTARRATMESVKAFCRILEDGWGEANSVFRQVWTSQAFPGASVEQQGDYNLLQRAACSPQDAAHIFHMNTMYDAAADLGHVRCPTLVLHSQDDPLIPFEEGRLIAASIPGARLVTFKSPNHVPLPGEPAFEQVMQTINEFLRDDVDTTGADEQRQ